MATPLSLILTINFNLPLNCAYILNNATYHIRNSIEDRAIHLFIYIFRLTMTNVTQTLPNNKTKGADFTPSTKCVIYSLPSFTRKIPVNLFHSPWLIYSKFLPLFYFIFFTTTRERESREKQYKLFCLRRRENAYLFLTKRLKIFNASRV